MGSLFTAFTRELPIVALILPRNELSPCVGLNPGKDFEPGPNDFEAELLRSSGTNSAIALLDPTVSENTWYVKILKYLLCSFVPSFCWIQIISWSKCKSCCSSEDVKHATDYIDSLSLRWHSYVFPSGHSTNYEMGWELTYRNILHLLPKTQPLTHQRHYYKWRHICKPPTTSHVIKPMLYWSCIVYTLWSHSYFHGRLYTLNESYYCSKLTEWWR